MKQYPEFNIAGTALNGCELLYLLKHQHVDIVVTDLHMPVKDGLATCKEIARLYPHIKIIVLSFSIRENVKEQLKLIGVKRFLNKDTDPEMLLQEIRDLAGTESRSVRSTQKNSSDFEKPKISNREQQIISLIVQGYTSSEIAEALFLSVHTVSQHRKNISRKLKLKNVQELVTYELRTQM